LTPIKQHFSIINLCDRVQLNGQTFGLIELNVTSVTSCAERFELAINRISPYTATHICVKVNANDDRDMRIELSVICSTPTRSVYVCSH